MIKSYKHTNERYKKLLEMSLGITGDYNFGKTEDLINFNFLTKFRNNSEVIFDKEVELKRGIKYNIIIETDGNTALIYNKDEVELMGYLQFHGIDISKFNYKYRNKYSNPLSITAVQTEEKYRNKGLMSFVYQFLIDNGNSIVGDAKEYDNARKLWLSMNKLTKYKLDVIDISRSEVLIEGITLKDIYDNRVWKILDPHQINGYLKNLRERQILFTRLIAYKV